MSALIRFESISKQLIFEIHTETLMMTASYGDFKLASTEEYIHHMAQCGDEMQKHGVGRILLDISKMTNFSLAHRAAGLNNLNRLMLSKIPFFLLAVVKGKNMFENLATQTAMNAARPLSKKFIDGKMFDNKEDAMRWLQEYNLPSELNKK